MVIKAQLFSKVSGQSCTGAKLKGFHVPEWAKTFDRVTGIGKKGKFDIVTFRNFNERALKRVARYVDEAQNETLKSKYWWYQDVYETTAVNGVVKEHVSKIFWHDDTYSLLYEQRLVNTDTGTRDFHKCARYKAGEKPRVISYETKWDGQAPEVTYQNIDGRLPQDGLEYLPLCISSSAIPRYHHVAKAQRMKYDLEGAIPEMKFVSLKEINPDGTNGDFIVTATADPETGQVLYAKCFTENEDIVRSIAHEHKHAYDFSKIIRLKYNADKFLERDDPRYTANKYFDCIKETWPKLYEGVKNKTNFHRKSIAKGIITEQDSEYWYYKYLDKHLVEDCNEQARTLESHDSHPVEIGAIAAGKKEAEKFGFIMKELFRLLTS